MRIEIEPEKCIASGQCVVVAEQVFDQDDDGIVELLTDEPGESDAEAVRDAAHVCPARVISVEE